MKFVPLFLMVLFALRGVVLSAEEGPQVIDQANIFTQSQKAQITKQLQRYHQELGISLMLYTVSSLEGKAVSQYSREIALQQGFRGEGLNLEGMIFISDLEKKVSIECGSGLEWSVPELFSRDINAEMIGYFKKGKFIEGVQLGFQKIVELAKKSSWTVEYTNTEKVKEEFVNGIGRVMALECRAVSKRIKEGMIGDDQINDAYFIYVKSLQNQLVKLHFTKYAVGQIEDLISRGHTKIYGRIAKTTPLDLDFLGFIEE